MMLRMYLAMERELLVVTRKRDATWYVESHLMGMQPTCIAVDPLLPERIYCGTFGRGLWCSEDAGTIWKPIADPGSAMEPYDGKGIPWAKVTALAVSANERSNGYGVVYAGTEPAALFRSEDGGATWQDLSALRDLPSAPTWSFPPRPDSNLVRCITPDPHVAGRLFVAIEAGALVYSLDGGNNWYDRTPDSPFDTHTLLMHPLAPDRLYSAAGDGLRSPARGYSESHDAGQTWRHPVEGREYHYLWGMAIDPADPDTVLVSASPNAHKAHHAREAAASTIYRKTAADVWHEVRNGLPNTQGVIAPVLASNPQEPHSFYALTNKGLYRSGDSGLTWEPIPLDWPAAYLTQHQQDLIVSTF
jgi:hypothetical protein